MVANQQANPDIDRDKAHQLFLGQKVPLSERHQADNESSSGSTQNQQKKVSILLDLQSSNITNQEELNKFMRKFEERKRKEMQLEELAAKNRSVPNEKHKLNPEHPLKSKLSEFQRASGVQFSRTGSKEVKDDTNLHLIKPDMEYKLAARSNNAANRRGMPPGYTQSLLVKSQVEGNAVSQTKPEPEQQVQVAIKPMASTKPSSSASQAQMKSPALSGMAKFGAPKPEVRGRTQSQAVKSESKR